MLRVKLSFPRRILCFLTSVSILCCIWMILSNKVSDTINRPKPLLSHEQQQQTNTDEEWNREHTSMDGVIMSTKDKLKEILSGLISKADVIRSQLNQNWYLTAEKETTQWNNIKYVERRNIFHKLVHLDLKGAPPRMSYLLEILPLLKELGATGLLVEYEDMFPYSGAMKRLQKGHGYTREEIGTFLSVANDNDLEVIPLVQTLGHLEFVLESWRYSHLREHIDNDNSMCPSQNESKALLYSMIDDMIDIHKGIRWLHLGGDEVYALRQCTLCLQSKDKASLYLSHMTDMMKYVKQKSNNQIIPIIWDDMIRRFTIDQIKSVTQHGEIMLWEYNKDLGKYIKKEHLEKYCNATDKVWVASAFKGANTINSDFVKISDRLENNRKWKDIVASLPTGCYGQGVAITGWSRYNHHSAICELLPSGIPSLAVCLEQWNNKGELNNSQIIEKVNRSLGMEYLLSEAPTFYNPGIPNSKFKGSDVYNMVAELELMRSKNIELSSNIRCYLTQSSSLPCKKKIDYNTLKIAALNNEDRFSKQVHISGNLLSKYFDEETVSEWISAKISPHIRDAARMSKDIMANQISQRKSTQNNNNVQIPRIGIETKSNTNIQQTTPVKGPSKLPNIFPHHKGMAWVEKQGPASGTSQSFTASSVQKAAGQGSTGLTNQQSSSVQQSFQHLAAPINSIPNSPSMKKVNQQFPPGNVFIPNRQAVSNSSPKTKETSLGSS